VVEQLTENDESAPPVEAVVPANLAEARAGSLVVSKGPAVCRGSWKPNSLTGRFFCRGSPVKRNKPQNKTLNKFMKKRLFLPVALTGFLIAGCSSTPTHVDSGPLKARTFNFVNGGAAPTATFADKREEVHKMIQDAIAQNLAGKGVSRVAENSDLTVAYLVIIGNEVSTEAIDKYFGSGRDTSALHDKAQDAYTKSKNPNSFQAGTLLIDIIDSKTYKLLERNYVVRPLLRKPSAEVRRSHIQEAVDEALKDLSVAK
jgi:hypothetical protein